jgi:flavin-binding protein dodecin
MEGSVYKIIEIVGVSATSWEDAAKVAIATASQTLEDLRIAEVVKQDVTIENGKVSGFRVRLSISFKYHPSKG